MCITLVRRWPIKLQPDALAAEWLALYAYEHSKRPRDPTDLRNFAVNRLGSVSYGEARKAVQFYADLAVPLADLPPPEESLERPGLESKACVRKSTNQPIGPETVVQRYQLVGGFAPGGVCAICSCEEGGKTTVELSCGGHHRFHKECIDRKFQGCANFSTGGCAIGAYDGNQWGYMGGVAPFNTDSDFSDSTTWPTPECPVCKRTALGEIQLKVSGVFTSQPSKSVADALRGKK
ncbi:unnamed protein product [Polarella glacialis]|nr:unnamed protein product [Polarella glacialis]